MSIPSSPLIRVIPIPKINFKKCQFIKNKNSKDISGVMFERLWYVKSLKKNITTVNASSHMEHTRNTLFNTVEKIFAPISVLSWLTTF